ncbi:MAG: D-lactate dehydrogenase (cytochrome) [Planctomycetaceae bacterium]|jgi:D-lactate dehydrogenase (cytochrome)
MMSSAMAEDLTIENCLRELRNALGERVTTDAEVLLEHGKDSAHHAPQAPDVVVQAAATEDVVAAVKICSQHGVPIIPFGTGTAVEGGVVATRGGVCVDVQKMNRINRLSVADMDVTVEAGVTRLQLNEYLAEQGTGLHFPVDPGADASLGGMAATRASGTAAVRYGTMRENVLGLEVVLASGEVIKTGGRARKSSAGYDLTHLLVGSEGTLGLITEVTLKLAPLPEAVSAAVCSFDSIDAAVASVIDVMSKGIPVARIELLDEIQMAAVNRYSDLSYEVAPTLFFEFHGSDAAVVEHAERTRAILDSHGVLNFHWASGQGERDRLWEARHNGYYATIGLREGAIGYVTDVCVPVSQLAECIRRTKADLAGCSVPAPLFGHVGDGNFHVVFPIMRGNEAELAEVKALGAKMVDHALALGGTCTGEHGIGIGKIDALRKEHGSAVDTMRAIKSALDPNNLMNPGKLFG